MDLPLIQRRTLLTRIIKPKNKVIELVPQKEAKTNSDVIEALDAAIMSR